MFRLTIDQGNSLTKCTVFSEDGVLDHIAAEDQQLNFDLNQLLKKYPIHTAIVSSVREKDDGIEVLQDAGIQALKMSHDLKMPFAINYQTPHTLGTDRLANAAGALAMFPNSNSLVLDFGTCLTYSILSNGAFIGGAIAPGIEIRLKSLPEFTGKLPLVRFQAKWPAIIGNSTENSILSGVIRGILAETDGMIEEYCSQIAELNVIITGGHHTFFEPHLKSTIFAAPLLTPKGLHEILLLNEA